MPGAGRRPSRLAPVTKAYPIANPTTAPIRWSTNEADAFIHAVNRPKGIRVSVRRSGSSVPRRSMMTSAINAQPIKIPVTRVQSGTSIQHQITTTIAATSMSG